MSIIINKKIILSIFYSREYKINVRWYLVSIQTILAVKTSVFPQKRMIFFQRKNKSKRLTDVEAQADIEKSL